MSIHKIIVRGRTWKQGVLREDVKSEINRVMVSIGLEAESEKQICQCGKDAEAIENNIPLCQEHKNY